MTDPTDPTTPTRLPQMAPEDFALLEAIFAWLQNDEPQIDLIGLAEDWRADWVSRRLQAVGHAMGHADCVGEVVLRALPDNPNLPRFFCLHCDRVLDDDAEVAFPEDANGVGRCEKCRKRWRAHSERTLAHSCPVDQERVVVDARFVEGGTEFLEQCARRSQQAARILRSGALPPIVPLGGGETRDVVTIIREQLDRWVAAGIVDQQQLDAAFPLPGPAITEFSVAGARPSQDRGAVRRTTGTVEEVRVEGYPMHIGCGGEVGTREDGKFPFCFGCERIVSEKEIQQP